MALINCEECGNSISDKAKVCPHCGYPNKGKGKGFAVTSLILGIIALVYASPIFLHIFLNASDLLLSAASVYVIIFAGLSFIFGTVSHNKGCSSKKKTAGLILSGVAVLIMIIAIVVRVFR